MHVKEKQLHIKKIILFELQQKLLHIKYKWIHVYILVEIFSYIKIYLYIFMYV